MRSTSMLSGRGSRLRLVFLGSLTAMLMAALAGCVPSSNGNTVIIYSSAEGMRNEAIMGALHEEFPQYDIRLRYLPTGNNAARLKTEGTGSEADIVFDLEGGYTRQVSEALACLPDTDMDIYAEDLVDPTRKSVPFARESACVAVNDKILEEKGLPVPQSYEDLLDPQYKGLICMANPKTSGTAYNFLKSLVNAYGEDEALAYFDKLADNVYQFTASGSGPINALVQGEAAIGLGLTFQAVTEINQGIPLSIHFFEEGSPWDVYSIGVIEGKQDKQAVMDVFGWLATEGVKLDNANFSADQVLRDFKGEIENYPSDIVYADMEGIRDLEEKERLLKEWKY